MGGTTVLGDLVLTATYQGSIYALDRTSGAGGGDLGGARRCQRLAGGDR